MLPSSSKVVEKFGRIFIKKRDASSYELLKSATFSNLDLKWYDLSGDIHSLYEKFKSEKFTMGFCMNNKNSEGSSERFEGRLLVPLNLGEIPGPDLEYLELAAKMEWDVVKNYGLITGEEGDEMTELFQKYQGASGFVVPGRKLLLQTQLPAYICIVNMLDDILDEISGGMSDSRRQIGYQQISKYFRNTMKIIQGKATSEDSVTSWEDMSQMFQVSNLGLHAILQLRRLYQCCEGITKSLREEVLQFGTDEEAKPLFDALLAAMESVLFEGCKEWANRNQQLFVDAQTSFKNFASGSTVAMEAFAFILRIRLSDEIRTSWLFNWYKQEVCSYGRKLNDLFSYNKEMEKQDAGENQVYVLHVEKKLSLTAALETVMEESNQSLIRVMECGKILLEMFDNDEELGKFVDMTKELISGGFAGLSHTSRYHDNFVFDCYVEEA